MLRNKEIAAIDNTNDYRHLRQRSHFYTCNQICPIQGYCKEYIILCVTFGVTLKKIFFVCHIWGNIWGNIWGYLQSAKTISSLHKYLCRLNYRFWSRIFLSTYLHT